MVSSYTAQNSSHCWPISYSTGWRETSLITYWKLGVRNGIFLAISVNKESHSFQLSSSWSILITSARVLITEVSSCHSPAQTLQEFSISQKATTSIPRGSLPSTAISLLTPAPLHPLSTNHTGLCVQPVASVNLPEARMVLLARILFSQMS